MDFKYDAEADVMAVKLIAKPRIAYAQEMGDVIVHFNKSDRPVYLEILNSRNFFRQATGTLPINDRRDLLMDEPLTLAKKSEVAYK